MITIRQEPFPHLIVEGLYTEQELKFIWQELDFLTNPKNFLPANFNGSTTGNHLSIDLDNFYTNRYFSNILQLNRKIYSKEILESFKNITPFHRHIKSINKDYTKINYYQNFNHYPSHIDRARFTAVTFLSKEPKKFAGGDLKFDEFNYLIPFKNNKMVMFCGSFYHSVTPVLINENDFCSGNGRYSITQFMDSIDNQDDANI